MLPKYHPNTEQFSQHKYGTREDDWRPLHFTSTAECVRMLLRELWEFPKRHPQQTSWAVKESDVLRGDIEKAVKSPGLGIALFTTELAMDIFGDHVTSRLQACVQWGLDRTSPSKPYLITEELDYRITGNIAKKGDFRHTVALAILMARAHLYLDHQHHYLKLVINSQQGDGSWPSELGHKDFDLPTTVYALEYVGVCKGQFTDMKSKLAKACQLGQHWLIEASTQEGGWQIGIFQNTNWDRLWGTAYITQRVIAMNFDYVGEWAAMLQKSGNIMLSDAAIAHYDNDYQRFRVEARVAAALRMLALEEKNNGMLCERMKAWLTSWELRSLDMLRNMPRRDLDLATVTFLTRGLITESVSITPNEVWS